MKIMKTLAAAAFALLFAGACGSMSDILGGGNNTNNNTTYDIRGTVDSVDLNSRSINLTNVANYSNALVPGGGSSGSNVRITYDDRTTVQYQGRAYRPQDLERGDQISVHVNQAGNQLLAESMNVLYNSRDGMASAAPPYGNASVVHGTVRSVDRYARTITVDPGYGSSVTVNYSSNTPVYVNGRSYLPTDLQIGDQVDVRVNDLGGGRLSAQDITVTRSISSNNSPVPSSSLSTMRGTVRYVDPSSRTIGLDNPAWISGFQTNSGRTLTVQYDANAQVSYQGQLYPVTNLEAGDLIEVQIQNRGGSNFLAQSITVVRNVNAR